MSSSTSVNTTATSTSTSTSQGAYFFHNLTTLGLGYAIAIALGFLVLFSALLLASYVFCRYRSSHRNNNNNNSSSQNPNPNPSPNPNLNAVVLPRIIFVAEDDEDDDGGPVPGLDEAAINSYPKFPYSKGSTNDTVCSICLCEYREGEMLRMLPDCRHSFHLSCVDAWLRLNASCPVCRTSPLPTPMSTPLSELVPLSQFNADRRRR